MKNSILNYEKETVQIKFDNRTVDYTISNYYSKKINLFDYFLEYSDYIEMYEIVDNDKIERISYELYGSANYWDILILLNDRNPLFHMPYDFDYLESTINELVEQYSTLIYFNSPISEKRTEELKNEWVEKSKEQNELLRYIYVIDPLKMPDFLKDIKSFL